jgi:hypothetical protein
MGIMNTSEQITELTQRWYAFVRQDHHKDRDCHFYIEKRWSYGEPPTYTARHHGYRAYQWESAEYTTAFEAEEELLRWLTFTINDAIMNIKERLAIPEEDLWTQTHSELQSELDALEGR